MGRARWETPKNEHVPWLIDLNNTALETEKESETFRGERRNKMRKWNYRPQLDLTKRVHARSILVPRELMSN